jgi:hypothetical protein
MEEDTKTILDQSDNCFVRARKLFKIIGLVDRMGLTNQMAEVIQAYMDLDKQKVENEEKNNE